MNEIQRTILEEAAEDDAIGREDPLRSVEAAVMNYIEGRIGQDGVIVGYGDDRSIHGSRDVPDEWYEAFPPIEGARFRVFYPESDEPSTPIPNLVSEVMAAIGATFVGVFNEEPDVAGTYDRRGKLSAHYVLPDRAPFVLAVGSAIERRAEEGRVTA